MSRKQFVLIPAGIMLIAALACNVPGDETQSTEAPAADTAAPVAATAESTLPGAAPVSSTVTPLPANVTNAAPPPAVPSNLTFEGISLAYDYSMAQAWTVLIVPADDPSSGAPGLNPTHYYFEFQGYTGGVGSSNFHKPSIYVFPVEKFGAFTGYTTVAAALQQYLASPPADSTATIPLLPVFNAQQVFRAKVQNLSFQNGSGVRFVTQYDQAFLPITSGAMFYTFQGITSDGKYYVSVIFPIAQPDFPAPAPANFDFNQDWGAYVTKVTQTLDAANPSSFNPTLSTLDALVQSISIQK